MSFTKSFWKFFNATHFHVTCAGGTTGCISGYYLGKSKEQDYKPQIVKLRYVLIPFCGIGCAFMASIWPTTLCVFTISKVASRLEK